MHKNSLNIPLSPPPPLLYPFFFLLSELSGFNTIYSFIFGQIKSEKYELAERMEEAF
jgi:hypothetical protein